MVYERCPRENNRLSGEVVIEFDVRYGLVIEDVVITESTTGDEDFGEEIGAELLAFDWPSAPLLGGTIRFSRLFVFAPQR